jgi:hypothetical protein
MRAKLLGILVAAATFAQSSRCLAASVDITVELVPGTTNWLLRVSSHVSEPVGGISLTLSNSLGDFTPAITVPPTYCVQDSCMPVAGPDTHTFSLAILNSIYGGQLFQELVPPNGETILGSFASLTSSKGDIQVLPSILQGNDLTVIDVNGAPIPGYSIHVVPEPVPSGLALLALLTATRRPARGRRGSRA